MENDAEDNRRNVPSIWHIDIDIAVFNADTGEKVLEDNFRDFKEFDQRNYDEILGLFENLRSLETQLVGIFVPQETSAARYVFTE